MSDYRKGRLVVEGDTVYFPEEAEAVWDKCREAGELTWESFKRIVNRAGYSAIMKSKVNGRLVFALEMTPRLREYYLYIEEVGSMIGRLEGPMKEEERDAMYRDWSESDVRLYKLSANVGSDVSIEL